MSGFISTIGQIGSEKMVAIGFDYNNTGVITVGTMKAEFSALSTNNAELYDTDKDAFVEAADEFYLKAVSTGMFDKNDTAFNAFVQALNVVNGFDGSVESAVSRLKSSYSALTYKEVMLPASLGSGEELTLKDTTDNKDKLGDKYVEHTLLGGDALDNIDRVMFTFADTDANYNVGKLCEFTVYVKSTGGVGARPLFHVAEGNRRNLQSVFSADVIGADVWSELKMSNLPKYDDLWKSENLGGISDRPLTAISLDFASTGSISVGSMVVEFAAYDKDVLSLAESDIFAFYRATADFYEEAIANNYFAPDDKEFIKFKSDLDILTNILNGEEYAFSKAVSDIGYYWSKMTDKRTLIPYGAWVESRSQVTELTTYDADTYQGSDLAETSVLGPKYTTYTAIGGNAADNKDTVLFKFADGENPNITIGDINSIKVYIKADAATGARPKYIYGSNDTVFQYSSFFNIGAENVGKWFEGKVNNVSSLPELSSNLNNTLSGIGLDISNAANFTIGSMEISFTCASESDLALKDTDVSLFIAKAMLFCREADKSGKFADNAVFASLKQAVEDICEVENNDEIIVLAKLKAGWLGLSDNNTFPKSNTTNWNIADWVYAANRVDTGSLTNTEDFVEALADAKALRDLLGQEFTSNISTYSTYADAQASLLPLENNLIEKIKPAIYYFDGNNKNEVSIADSSAVTDNDYASFLDIPTVNAGNGAYVELIYRFEGGSEISDFVIGHNSDAALRNTDYKIYVADSIENLLKTDSMVVGYNNADNAQIQIFNFEGKPRISGSYIAFRIYTNGDSVTVGELGVYGEFVRYDVKTGDFTDEFMKSLGDNLIAGEGVIGYTKPANLARNRWTDSFSYPMEYIYDCSNDTGVGFGSCAGSSISADGEEISLHIMFDLRETYYIKKLLINHWKQTYLQAGKFEIYASDNYATLFKSGSKIVSYDNMHDGENGTTNSQLFTAKGDGVIARYISFRIVCPISNYEKGLIRYAGMCYPRINDLGVFGERYYKPLNEINFLNRVPVEAYRTDDNGNKTIIGESEFGYSEYIKAADGDYTVAIPIAQNGKTVDFVYNLCADKTINSVKLSALTENLKGVKVYASASNEGVWLEENCVLNYKGDATNQVSRSFGDEPIEARYVRFSIVDTESGIVDATEFEVIGWNIQEFVYINLAEGKSEDTSVLLENKDNYELTVTDDDAGKFVHSIYKTDLYDISNAFDGDEDSNADLFNGSRGNADGTGRVTINLLIDLGALDAVDGINFKAGGSYDYLPDKLNFYLGEEDLALFGKDAKPIKEFTSKTENENGYYEYNFLPQTAQYVRIEIVSGTQRYYEMLNKIGVIISEIEVNGIEVVGHTASEGIAASITDEQTGIRVDIEALRDNDIFSKLQDLAIVKRQPTVDEKKALNEQGIAFTTDIYDIFLLDDNGDIITDVGGRNIKICLPKSMFNGDGDPYVVASIWGEYTMVEFVEEDGFLIATATDPFGLSYAICEFVTDSEEIDNESPTDMDNAVEDDDADESEEEADEDDKPKKKKKIKVVRKNNGDDFDYLPIIISSVIVVVAAAGITIFLILKKKKEKQEE
ncbi:MAG: hypothetical protein IJN15_04945 [Clostridia bacterium]|nr:hypothetical protein [Clostridia bacterium]